MPWKEETQMSLRKEFVEMAKKENANISELCRRYQISRKTGYKWLKRAQEGGEENLKDVSKRPHHSPNQTQEEMEKKVCEQRKENPAWGGRKLRRRLENLGESGVPAASTITEILRRHKKLDEKECEKHKPWKRFERQIPNELWQMDFKGDVTMLRAKCYPLSIEDDCSRFLIGLFACPNQQRETTQNCIEATLRKYGMPRAILMDNGNPWRGSAYCEYTQLWIWFLRLGIRILHGRPYHPQTQGKVERFHRSFDVEVIQRETFANFEQCQRRFDAWREKYNFIRPHEALQLDTPASRYQPSLRTFPEILPPVEYEPGAIIRKVHDGGRITYLGQEYRVGHAFTGYPVVLQPTTEDGVIAVYFCQQKIRLLDLRSQTAVEEDTWLDTELQAQYQQTGETETGSAGVQPVRDTQFEV